MISHKNENRGTPKVIKVFFFFILYLKWLFSLLLILLLGVWCHFLFSIWKLFYSICLDLLSSLQIKEKYKLFTKERPSKERTKLHLFIVRKFLDLLYSLFVVVIEEIEVNKKEIYKST